MAALFDTLNSVDGPPPPPPVAMTGEAVRRDLLVADPRAALLVAELDGRLVGFATGNAVYDPERAADAFFLNDLRAAPEARRRGARCLRWGVDLGDADALRFHDASGAEDEGGFVGRILVGPAFEALASQETG